VLSPLGPVSPATPENWGGTIETLAGTGQMGCEGDDGPALQARFKSLSGLAVDREGNVYISDVGCHTVRKVDRSGRITRVAGTGELNFNGDGRPAMSANLATPGGLTFDRDGNLYIADNGHHRIRRVGADSLISTVVGGAVAGSCGDGGPALAACLRNPADMAWGPLPNPAEAQLAERPRPVTQQAMYIADIGNNRIRRLGPGGAVITVAGTGQRGFAGDNGPARKAQFRDPISVAVMPSGRVLIVDRSNHRIREFDPLTRRITTIAGNGVFGPGADDIPAIHSSLRLPQDVAVDKLGNIYIADSWNHRIRRLDRTGFIRAAVGTGQQGFGGDGGPALQATLNGPSAVALDAVGNIYIADFMNYRVRVVRLYAALQ
jgi:DNA-binding beta-propeller fold protein YncE